MLTNIKNVFFDHNGENYYNYERNKKKKKKETEKLKKHASGIQVVID